MGKTSSTIHVDFYKRNLALLTRRSVKLSVKDEKIFKFEIATPSIREGAVPAAKNEETNVYMVANPFIREGAVPAAKNEEFLKFKGGRREKYLEHRLYGQPTERLAILKSSSTQNHFTPKVHTGLSSLSYRRNTLRNTSSWSSDLQGKLSVVPSTIASKDSKGSTHEKTTQSPIKEEKKLAAELSSISSATTKTMTIRPPVIPLSVSHSWSHVYGEMGCRGNPWRKDLVPIFREWTEISKKNNMEYVLSCGSLLGALRTADVIPYDSDMDILIDIKYFPKLKEISVKRNFDVSDGSVRLVIQPEFELNISTTARKRYTCKGKLSRSMVDVCSFQDPMARLVRKHLQVDIYPFYTKGDIIEDTTDGFIRTYKTNDMFPLRACKFMGFDSFCPHNPWNILKAYYHTDNFEANYKCKSKKWVDKNGKTAL